MKIEDQVCSLELAKRLRELCMKQESLFCWGNPMDKYSIFHNWERFQEHYLIENECYSAFTAPELGELLPYEIHDHYLHIHKCFVDTWECVYLHDLLELKQIPLFKSIKSENLVDCLAKMLIHLIENELMTVSQ